jgi:hypothetical protein
MAKQPRKPRSRVVLAADAGSDSVPSVSLAVDIASSAGSLLHGLFVEDEDLLQITRLPCTREISLTTATERSTSSEQMQRSLRLVAHQFRQTLQQQAQALRVAWSFDTRRGRVHEIGLQPESDVTFTILANPSTHRLASARPQLVRRILLLGDNSQALEQALDILIERYAQDDIELIQVENGRSAASGLAAEGWLQRYGGRLKLTGLPLRELLLRLEQPGAAYDFAILAGYREGEETSLLLKALRCPIILTA